MTIMQHTGDLMDQQGILVHGCNCMGVMGSGVADLVRRKYPAAYKAYAHRYEVFGLQLGDIIAVANPAMRSRYPKLVRHIAMLDPSIPDGMIVVNALSQFDFGRNKNVLYADYTAIEAAFVRIRMLAEVTGLPVHFPLIGCGLANGKWHEVAPRIEKGLGPVGDANLWLLPGMTTN